EAGQRHGTRPASSAWQSAERPGAIGLCDRLKTTPPAAKAARLTRAAPVYGGEHLPPDLGHGRLTGPPVDDLPALPLADARVPQQDLTELVVVTACRGHGLPIRGERHGVDVRPL